MIGSVITTALLHMYTCALFLGIVFTSFQSSQVETIHNDTKEHKLKLQFHIFPVMFIFKNKKFIRLVTGVFFNNRVEHVKFVDFCGKYRLPLLQYLCSRKCIESRDGDEVVSGAMIRKVLLG